MTLPKATGADIEFGNSIIGQGANMLGITSWTACNYLLSEAPGWRNPFSYGISPLPGRSNNYYKYGSHNAYAHGQSNACDDDDSNGNPSYAAKVFRDYDRSWSIYCLYGDMGHTEGCLPITISCFDHVAALHGLYNTVAVMRQRAKTKLPAGQDLFVTINNTDGDVRTSYGAHLNVLIQRQLFDDILFRKPHYLGFAASVLAAVTPIFGQGHVLCVPGKKPRYVLSQRAHHLGVLVSPSTTTAFRRPLINSRDESHAHKDMARLHLINFDASLQQYTTLFRVWFMQSFLAAMEDGYCDSSLMLDDPILALKVWSSGFSPKTGRIQPVCLRVNGKSITLVEHLESLTEGIDKAYTAGSFSEEEVPGYQLVFPKWVRLLKALGEGDVQTCAAQLDWALKFMIVDREMLRTGHDLDAPEIKLLDQLYGHVDKGVGLYWGFESAGAVDRCVSQEQIGYMHSAGPDNTRAYMRKAILEKFGDSIVSVDWGEIRIRVPNASGLLTTEKRILLDNPLRFTKHEMEPLLQSSATIGDFCAAFDARRLRGELNSKTLTDRSADNDIHPRFEISGDVKATGTTVSFVPENKIDSDS